MECLTLRTRGTALVATVGPAAQVAGVVRAGQTLPTWAPTDKSSPARRPCALSRSAARPDLLCIDRVGDGAIEALELSSARTPTLDKVAVEQMAAIDLLVLTRSPAYALLPHRILVCGLETGRLYDVTPSRDRARDILHGIDAYLKDIEARGCAWDEGGDVGLGRALATPSPDACGRCAYRGDCAYAWPSIGDGRDGADAAGGAAHDGWSPDGTYLTGTARGR